MSVTHILALPAPPHLIETACGLPLPNVPSGDRLTSDPDKVTCDVCRLMIGRNTPNWTAGLPKVSALNIEGNTIQISIAHSLAGMLARAFYKELEETGTRNYMELSFEFHEEGVAKPVIVTIQRPEGKTPHQLRVEAEAKLEALQKRLLESVVAERENYEKAVSDVALLQACLKQYMDGDGI